MIPVGTRVIVHWDLYDYVDKINMEYLGTETFHGIVLPYNDSGYDKQMEKDGRLKIKIFEKEEVPDDIVYCGEYDIEIENS